MLNVLGIIVFIFAMFVIAWLLNYVIVFYGDKRGWFKEQPRKTRWYDKYFDRMHEIYIEELERKRDGI